jgi:hypothetical protein
MGLGFWRRNGARDVEQETVSVRSGVSPRAIRGAAGGPAAFSSSTAVLDRDAQGRGPRMSTLGSTEGRSIVLTYDGWRVGELLHDGPRVLDALSSPVLYLRSEGRTREIDRDDVVMVVPPPLTEVSRMRIAKQPIDVSVDIGVATVKGKIHVLAGVGAWDTWQRSTSGFVAITEVTLDFPDGTAETADVVLVSRHAAHAGLREVDPPNVPARKHH